MTPGSDRPTVARSISRIAAGLALSVARPFDDTRIYAASAPIGRIARIDGTEGARRVSVKYRDTDSFVSVWRHEKIGAGDTIATGIGRRRGAGVSGRDDPCPRAVGGPRDHAVSRPGVPGTTGVTG